MNSQRSQLGLIFATVFINLIGFGIVIPVLPLYAQRFGAGPLVIGFLVSVYSIAQMIFAPILGKISDRVGRRPILLLSIAGTAGGFLLMGAAKALPLLFVGRIIDGITGGNVSTAQAYIADITSPEQRSKRMGLIGAAFGLGFIFGPAIGGVMSRISLSAPFFFAAGLAFFNALLVYFFLPESLSAEHRGAARKGPALTQILRDSKGGDVQIVLAAYFFVTIAFSMLTATYPLFVAHRFGYSAMQIGYIFAGLGLVSALIQGGMLGALVKILGDKGLTVLGAVILSAGFLALPFSSTRFPLLWMTGAIAVGHSFVAAPLNSLASKSVGTLFQGRVLGAMQSAASFARIIGPVLGGWLLDIDFSRSGSLMGAAPYWTGCLIALVSLVFASRLKSESALLRSQSRDK